MMQEIVMGGGAESYWAEDLRKCPNPKWWRQLKSAIVIERTSEKEKAERNPLKSKGRMIILIYIKKIIKVR